jgi:hypothetical protein
MPAITVSLLVAGTKWTFGPFPFILVKQQLRDGGSDCRRIPC